MQVVLHTGVHETDGDKLFKTLLRNRDGLRAQGVAVPGPGKYRKLISETLNAMAATPATLDAPEDLVGRILDQDQAQVDRLILSHENLFSVPKIAFSGGRLYRKAEQRLRAMQQIFSGHAIEVHLAVRNPATFLPALLKATPHTGMSELLNGLDPASLRWSEFLGRLVDAVPGVPITVWCDEDSPLVWGQIVREIAGVDPTYPIIGAYSRLAEIMTQEGMTRFRAYVSETPDLTEIQIRRAMVAFLDKYGDESAIEHEIDVPGWTEAYIQALTEQYDDDLFELARLPGVTLIAP